MHLTQLYENDGYKMMAGLRLILQLLYLLEGCVQTTRLLRGCQLKFVGNIRTLRDDMTWDTWGVCVGSCCVLSQSLMGVLNPVKNLSEHGCARTFWEWMFININGPNLGNNFIAMRSYLQQGAWVIYSALSQHHFINVLLVWSGNLTSAQRHYNSNTIFI